MVAAPRRPILSQSCAVATTAAEYRYRVDRPNSADRSSRVIALDDGAAEIVGRLAEQPWVGARFLNFEGVVPVEGEKAPGGRATVRALDGSSAELTDEVVAADVVIMIATGDDGREGADVIGQACAERGVMTAGLVVGGRAGADEAINTLRPNTMVLVVLDDERDAVDVLTALRA
jgi:hypothetical protein